MRCPACGRATLREFVTLGDVPVFCNVLWATADEARRAPRGEMRLGFCDECALIYNVAFDPALVAYSPDYENSLHFSPRFQSYATALARSLVDRHGIRGRRVVEIGCGKGEFLALLREAGAGEAIGFDASYDPERLGPAAASVTVVRDQFSARHAAAATADLVVCRHVLEHVAQPLELVASVRAALDAQGGGAVYFEVPNALYTVANLGIWDLIYEHASYFTAPALVRLFARAGFATTGVTPAFEDQFLALEAQTATSPTRADPAVGPTPAEIAGLVERFAGARAAKIERHRRQLAELSAAGRRIAVWGIGSKGVTFLNLVPEARAVVAAVDLNPAKHGRWIAGVALEVAPPEALTDQEIDDVLIMNPNYRAEIEQRLAALGVRARTHVV